MKPDSPRTDIPSSRSLLIELLKWYLPLFLVIGFFAGGGMIFQLRQYYGGEIDQRLRQRTKALANLVTSQLKSLRSQSQLITGNGLVVNSTIDTEQGESDIEPFFNTLDVQELENETLSLHNYRGRPIATNSSKKIDSLASGVMKTTRRKGGYFKLDPQKLSLVVPVRVHGTINGYLSIRGGQTTVRSLFQSIFTTVPDDSFVGVQDSSGTYLWRNRSPSFGENTEFVPPRSVNIPATSLSVLYSERQDSLYDFLNTLTLQILALLGVGFLFTFGGLIWLGQRVIGPLTRLTNQLDQKERRFREMSEAIDQAFYLAEPDFSDIIYANPAFETIFGVSPEDCYDDPLVLKRHIPEEEFKRLKRTLDNHTFTSDSDNLQQELTVNHPERGQRKVRSEIYPVFKEGGLHQIVGTATDVTEQMDLQNELKEQRQFLRTIVESQPQLIFVKDWDGEFRLANEALANIYNTTPEELEGKRDADFIQNEKEVESFREDDREVMETGEIMVIPEEPLTDPRTGDVYWYETIKVPLFVDRPPEDRQILGVATEITDRLETQRELERKNQRLNLAKRAGNTGIWDYDTESGDLNWDDQMIENFGRNVDEYDDFLDCVHPDDRSAVDSAVREAIQSAEDFHQEYRINRDGDGDLRWIDAHAVVHVSEDGSKKMIGSCRDITRQKRDERFLRRLNSISSDTERSHDEQIEDVLELGAEYFDLSLGFVTQIDERTQEIRYVYGQHPEIEPGARADLSKAYCQKTIKEDAPIFLNSTDKIKEVLGEEPYETFGLSCYLGGKLFLDGDIYGTVCFADQSDHTDKQFDENDRAKLEILIQWIKSQMERKRAFKSIKAAQQEAEEANQAKSQFLARMSHEIRTPLNAIMGMADLLSETPLDEEQEHYVSVFQNSSEILLNLINDVLDLSKIEAGELELHRSYFDIEQLIIDTAEFFAEKAHGKGLELNAFVDPDCPPAVESDINRFRQVLVNLIGNAIKFTEEGEVNVNLHVMDRDRDEVHLRLEVEDTGEGIATEEQEHIFGEFAQTDESSTREQSGTGLGLSICQNLISKMGGEIGVDSEPGEGSTFHVEVSFPWREQPPDDSALYDVDIDRLAGHSVLVVDDNATNREILEKYCRSADLTVDTCSSGEEALEQLKTDSEYDVIFMDNQMPGSNGFDVIKQLPGDYGPEDVVMLTSNGMKKSRETAKTFDLGGYHIKPISRGKLLRVLSEHLFESSTDQPESVDQTDGEAEEAMEQVLSGRLLLVEDDDNNRILVSSYLKEHDIEIDDAVNGEQALELLKENDYDLVLMDLDMPVMDGYEATSRYREWEEDGRTSIVALSAHAMEASQTKAEESGCDDYLSKPIQKDKLLETVRSYLDLQED